jgi:rhodanese-related sulfurtransferase/rubrerythrin
MGVMDYFKPVSTWTPAKVREFIGMTGSGDFNLVDVRQPEEYEQGHIPGARLIPVGRLPDRVSELDPQKTTIVYCAAGVRSRAAASILERAGFREVHSMSGGIHAWQGLVAEGYPEAGAAWFGPTRTAGEQTALAWALEEATGIFYVKMAEALSSREYAGLFRELAAAEERHKEMLSSIYREVTGAAGAVDFPVLLGGHPRERVMEGGMALDDALAWSRGKTPRQILELCLSLEAGSYDRYLAMQERVTSGNSRKLFRTLAAEEKRHLEKLAAAFDKSLG